MNSRLVPNKEGDRGGLKQPDTLDRPQRADRL
jgi:hypothetical protein